MTEPICLVNHLTIEVYCCTSKQTSTGCLCIWSLATMRWRKPPNLHPGGWCWCLQLITTHNKTNSLYCSCRPFFAPWSDVSCKYSLITCIYVWSFPHAPRMGIRLTIIGSAVSPTFKRNRASSNMLQDVNGALTWNTCISYLSWSIWMSAVTVKCSIKQVQVATTKDIFFSFEEGLFRMICNGQFSNDTPWYPFRVILTYINVRNSLFWEPINLL